MPRNGAERNLDDKWCYSHDEENYHGDFDTREEAIAEAQADEPERECWVGKTVGFTPRLDVFAESILSDVLDQAHECCGEAAEGWLGERTKAQEQDLGTMLNEAFQAWMTKHKQWPHFYGVKESELVPGQKEIAPPPAAG